MSGRLAALTRRKRLRSLEPRAGSDFASNDYLGLATSPELGQAARDAIARGVPVGAGASRLLRGTHSEHDLLEQEAAAFFGAEAALYFAGGFIANAAIFATLPQRGDLIVHDELIHASAHDGMRLSKAEAVAARHNDAQAVEDAIRAWRAHGGTGRPWIAVESLYSMDGDIAPLDDLMVIADRHDGVMVIDEAHATGVFGPSGRGLGAHLEGRSNVVSLHTCGKALGVAGGIVCGPRIVRDYLVNRCRPLIYATAPSPLTAAVVRAALTVCATDTQRRAALRSRIVRAGTLFAELTGRPATGTQILPVVIGRDEAALAVAASLMANGFDVRAIRPPTVPEGTARLRICLTLNVDDHTTNAMFAALHEALGDALP
ncbi:MAG: 8-amino-7-oxononanoate synthase [Hyphomicrobiaceae bacterium]|nr:8-amino-7-oxononanoate synthase [Hyphomicrobiaceae bacterium]